MGKSKTHKMAARCDERHSKGYWLSVPPGRRTAAKLLSKEEARRIAVNIAKLPELLRNGQAGGNQIMQWLRESAGIEISKDEARRIAANIAKLPEA